jgi:hypothetical protein
MRKLFILLLTVTLFSYSSKAGDYEDGYVTGFSFANQQLEYYINMHPEYGFYYTPNVTYNQVDQYGGVTQIGYQQYLNASPASTFVSYSIGSYYSAAMAWQAVVNSFYVNGGIAYLQQQSTQSAFYLGMYDGFMGGISYWLMMHG